MALVRVYCGLASADGGHQGQVGDGGVLTAAVVDDAGRLLDVCEIGDDANGYAMLGSLLAERSTGPIGVSVAADSDDHLVTMLLTAAGRPLAVADDDAADDFAERFADDESLDEIQSQPAERRAVGLARALQAGALSATAGPAPRDLAGLKPVLAAHAALAHGRHAAAVALREVLRELYPAALRAYPDPAEQVALAVLEVVPEPSILGASGHGRGRDAVTATESVAAQLAASGIIDQHGALEAVTALRVAIAETPRRAAVSKHLTAAVSEAVRQAVAAVRACDAASAALVSTLSERVAPPVAEPATPLRPRSTPTPAPQVVTHLRPTRDPSPPSTNRRHRTPVTPLVSPVPVTAPPVSPTPVNQPPLAPVASVPHSPMLVQPEPLSALPTPVTAPPAPVTAPPASVPAPLPPGFEPTPTVGVPVLPAVTTGPLANPLDLPVPQPQASAPAAAPPQTPPPPQQRVGIPAQRTPAGLAPADVGAPFVPSVTQAAINSARAERRQVEPIPGPLDAPGRGPAATDIVVPLTRPPADPGDRTNWPLIGEPDEQEDARFDEPSSRITPPWLAEDLVLPEPPPLRLVDTVGSKSDDGDLRLSRDELPPSRDELRLSREELRHGQEELRLGRDDLLRRTDLDEDLSHDRGGRPRSRRSAVERIGTELAPPPIVDEGDGDLLIFATVRSAWFTGHGEPSGFGDEEQPTWNSLADQGWRAAEQAARPAIGDETGVGLPRRVPQANLVPGSPINAAPGERPLRIVRDAERLAQHTSGYFRGWRAGQEVNGYAVGGRPGRESAGGWDFSREADEHDGYDYRAAGGYGR